MSVISSLRGGGVGQLWLWGPPEWHSQYRPDRNSLSPKKQTERNWLKSRLSIQMLPDLLFQVRRWDQQKCHLGLGGPASSPALPQSLKYGWAESTFCTLTSSKFRNQCPKEAGLRTLTSGLTWEVFQARFVILIYSPIENRVLCCFPELHHG